MTDPTYVLSKIKANPIWELAFAISEIMNDNAPIGWGKYIFVAQCLLNNYKIERLKAMTIDLAELKKLMEAARKGVMKW